METPKAVEDNERLIIGLYDNYIKTVLKNRSRTLCHRYYKRMAHECLIDDFNKYFLNMGSIDEISDTNVIDIQGLHCEIHNENVYNALILLPTNQLIVIILWYWYGRCTREIAEYFEVTDRTIRNWHNQAILFLRKQLRKVRT